MSIDMMTNTEIQVVHNVIAKLKHDERLTPDMQACLAQLRAWLNVSVITPLEMVADVTLVNDRHQRKMQLEAARGLSR